MKFKLDEKEYEITAIPPHLTPYSLLGQWGLIVMTAYFGGRSIEKIMEIRKKDK